MNRGRAVKLCAVFTIFLLLASPSAWGCSQCCTVCGPFCTQVFYDNYFEEDCAWEFLGATRRVNVSGDDKAEFYGHGNIYQEVDPAQDNDVKFDLDVINGSAAEGLAVDVVSTSGALLDTIAIVNTSGTYTYEVGNYTSYGTIRIRFRAYAVSETGSPIYRVDNAYFWIYPQ